MSWIKRNLYFVAGSAVALLLLVAASWYGFTKWRLDQQSWTELNQAYEELKQLGQQKPNPGNEKVDNVKLAREQQAQLAAEIRKISVHFKPVPPIPDRPEIGEQDFANALRKTVSQLQRDAASASVTLQPDYSFSFFKPRQLVKFEEGSPPRLAAQLGEAKTICDVLFAAKVNSLDSLRRERVSTDDLQGPASDYLDEKSVTNELAVLTPYEVTFRCFSGELAGVMSGFANQPHGIVIRSLNVEQPNAATMGAAMAAYNPMAPGMGTPGGYPGGYPSLQPGQPGYPGMSPQGFPSGMPGAPGTPGVPGAGSVVRKGGLPVILDEKPVKVTMIVAFVKLLPKK